MAFSTGKFKKFHEWDEAVVIDSGDPTYVTDWITLCKKWTHLTFTEVLMDRLPDVV